MGLVIPFCLGVMKFDSNPDKNPDLSLDFENLKDFSQMFVKSKRKKRFLERNLQASPRLRKF
jgi:hypothetical protein